MRRTTRLLLLCLVGLSACGWPATVEVANESSNITVRGTVPFSDQNGSVTIRVQYPIEPYTWLWFSVATPTLTSPSQNSLSINAAADWSSSFQMPWWAWKDGAQGSFSRYFVHANAICSGGVTCDFDLASEPVDPVCAGKALADGVRVGAGFCRPASLGPGSQVPVLLMGYPAMSAEDVASPTEFLRETGYYFHACTSDFLPEGNHRRSYCDRPYADVRDRNGKVTTILTQYDFDGQSPPSLAESVTWVGDGATILALHDTHLGGRYLRTSRRARYYPYFGSRGGDNPNTWSTSGYDDEVSLIDLGECSARVDWNDIMAGVGSFPGFVNIAPNLIAQEFAKDSRVNAAYVSNLSVTVRPGEPANSAPDAPRYFRTGPMLLRFHVFAQGNARREFHADIEMGLGLHIRSNQAMAVIETVNILSLDAGGVWELDESQIYDSIRGNIGSEFDLSEEFNSAADALGFGQLSASDFRRLVVTLSGLHVVLAEDGGDPNYTLLNLGGACGPASTRMGPWSAEARWWP